MDTSGLSGTGQLNEVSAAPARAQQFLSSISGSAHLEFICPRYTEKEPEAII
jgi:hypothetical protein